MVGRRNSGVVLGEVELWGRIIEHEHGFRAQHAEDRASVESDLPGGGYQHGKSVVSGLRRAKHSATTAPRCMLYDSKTKLPVDLDAPRRLCSCPVPGPRNRYES